MPRRHVVLVAAALVVGTVASGRAQNNCTADQGQINSGTILVNRK